ncbi:MAG: FecR domain-containing protein [Pseudomonadota bacterium]|nr:FecR domain-containing protein [Pseudomonadota bacterium]
MSDWLFDGGEPDDPEEERIAAALGGLRRERVAPVLPERPRLGEVVRIRRWSVSAIVATTALLAAAALLAVWPRDRLDVSVLYGGPACWIGACGLGVGGELVTSDSDAWTVRVGTLGTVQMAPDTVLARLPTDAGQLLALRRGAIDVSLTAPPREVRVETAAALVVDLGCEYALSADETHTVLTVRDGSVALENDLGTTIVTAGSSAEARVGERPDLPIRDDADPAFRAAIERFDAGARVGPDTVEELLAEARPEDNVTLWHVLQLLPPDERAMLFDGMSVPGDREAVLRLDAPALVAWWRSAAVCSTRSAELP